MALFKRFHDLSGFCGENARGYNLAAVKYDDASRRLIATDAQILAIASVQGNAATSILLPGDKLAKVLKKLDPADKAEANGDAKQLQISGQTIVAEEGRFPDVFKACKPGEPQMLLVLSPKVLKKLAEHAELAGAESIYLGIQHGDKENAYGLELAALPNGKEAPMQCAVTFVYEAADKNIIGGLLMPATPAEPEKVKNLLEWAFKPEPYLVGGSENGNKPADRRKAKKKAAAEAAKPEAAPLSPMLGHYKAAKAECPEAILLFRMGDFYESYNEDAQAVAKILSLPLTYRKADGEEVPMTGFPHSNLETYLKHLIKEGKRVAVCDQVGASPSGYQPPRVTTRVVTPESPAVESKSVKKRKAAMAGKEDPYVETPAAKAAKEATPAPTSDLETLLAKARTAIDNCKANSTPGFRASAKRNLNAAAVIATGKDTDKVKALQAELAALPTTVFKNRQSA